MGNSSKKDTIDLFTIGNEPNGLTSNQRTSDSLKLVVLGSSKVGKSCLILRYVAGHFLAEWEATVEESFRKTALVDNMHVLLEILDTGGETEFQAMMDQYMRVGSGFLVVYSVTDRQSFDKCADIYKQILRVKDVDSAPIVLIGNQSDNEKERQVPKAHGEELAKQLGCPFFETSAKDKINVDAVFEQLIQHTDSKTNTPHKIGVIGDVKVGKTALIMRFALGTYEGTPSDDCRYERSFVLDGSTVFASIIDINAIDSGNIEAARDDQRLREFVTRQTEGILLVYDITNRKSFEYCTTFDENPLRLAFKDDPDKPIILVGNKIDLDHARVVSTAEAQKLASLKGWHFFETSATKTVYDLDSIFSETLRQIAKGHVSGVQKSSKG